MPNEALAPLLLTIASLVGILIWISRSLWELHFKEYKELKKQVGELSVIVSGIKRDNEAISRQRDLAEKERDQAQVERDAARQTALDESIKRARAEVRRDELQRDNDQLSSDISSMKEQLNKNTEDISSMQEKHKLELEVVKKERDEEHSGRVAAETENTTLHNTIDRLERKVDELERTVDQRFSDIQQKQDTDKMPPVDIQE